jgi:two-component system chemotaxis sensor kinase CheA
MQVNDRLYRTFLDDGKTFSRNIHHLLLKAGKKPGSAELLRQLLRNTHSLKSEASYIGITEIGNIAHRMETVIGEALEGKKALTRTSFDELLLSNDRIGEVLDFLIAGGGDALSPETHDDKLEKKPESEQKDAAEAVEEPVAEMIRTSIPDFTPFETGLLREARTRGERLFRLSLTISQDAPMPFAKAYLLLSNLEQEANVIRTFPLFRPERYDEQEAEEYRNLTVFLTSSGEMKKIYQAVHIDHVDAIRLTPVSFVSVLEEEPAGEMREAVSGAASIRLDPKTLNKLTGYIDELKLSLHQLRRRAGRFDDTGTVKAGLEELTGLVDGLETVSRSMSKVRLRDLFSGYDAFIADMAGRLGKKIRFRMSGSDIDVDRRIAELLSETVLHLVRNAVDHGIELPRKRLESGKNEEGLIELSIGRGEGGLSLRVTDDGAGIDKNEIIALLDGEDDIKGEAEGIGGGRANELAALLARPGLTTKDEATEYSGRGFGLDIVYRKIGRIEGAFLEAESEKGKGASFTITIPGGVSFITLKMVRWEKMVLAVPERNILSIEQAGEGTFGGDSEGRLEWNGIPVFSPEGRLFRTDLLPPQESAIIMQHLDRKGVFLVDELLFTREVPEEQFTLFVEESPFLYRSTIGGRKSGFHYLSPSVVTI